MPATFVIRKIAYHYSDEYLYVHTPGSIENIFSSKEEAYKKWHELERERLEEVDLGDTEQLSPCSREYLKEALEFKAYWKRKFNEEIVQIDEYGNVYCERDTRLPKDLSDQEIEEIRDVLKLNFYEITEYENAPAFYAIWLKDKMKYHEYLGTPYFYSTYIQALEAVKSKMNDLLEKKEIKGTLREISHSPLLLQSLINHSNTISYDKDKKLLTTNYINQNEAIALNELLKDKLFEIKEIPMSMVENIDNWAFEEM